MFAATINLFNTEFIILVCAIFALIGWVIGDIAHKYNIFYLGEYECLFINQPYAIALSIIGIYFFVNDLSLPIIHLGAIFQRNGFISENAFNHILETVKFLLIVVLLLKEESVFYAWLETRSKKNIFKVIMLNIRSSFRIVFSLLIIWLIIPDFVFFPMLEKVMDYTWKIAIVWSVAWLICDAAGVYENILLKNHPILETKEFGLRSAATKAHVVKKILTIVIFIIAGAVTFMLFEETRALGASIFASAGIIAGIVSFSLRSVIENFLLGLQIAFSQPIKINDAIEIDGEYGTIEEITLNYVIIKLWDYRRLIVPIKYFIENKFLNLSRNSTNIISSIFFVTDHTIPVKAVREEFIRIIEQSLLWDKNILNLQVVNIKSDHICLRGVVSTHTPGDAWNIKCELLEKINEFITMNYPDSLPKLRIANTSDSIAEKNF